ncbi:MAG: hypothetical protein QGG40_19430, partial [Myxococcota bacterium]|nr:hypothetical protein [Myxococcota bacterium]
MTHPARRAFQQLLIAHGERVPLDRAAAWIAAEEQDHTDIAPALAHLDQLASGLHLDDPTDPFRLVAMLNL